MRFCQPTRAVATIVIQRYGHGYRVTDDAGEFDGLEDEDGRSYMPRTCDDFAEAYEHAREIASEYRQTNVDPREGRGECYLVQIEHREEGAIEVLEPALD